MKDLNDYFNDLSSNDMIIMEKIKNKTEYEFVKKEYSSSEITKLIETFTILFPDSKKTKLNIQYKQFRGLVSENNYFYSLNTELLLNDKNLIIVKRTEIPITKEMFPNLSKYDHEYNSIKYSCKTKKISLDIIDNKYVKLIINKNLTIDEIKQLEIFSLSY